MDKEKRDLVDQQFREKILASQRSHIAKLEGLERDYGLDLDVYTDLYGEGSLDGSDKAAMQLVEGWNKIFSSLESSPITAIVRTRQELRPGCYGFGAKAEYNTFAEVVVIKGGADIVSVRNESTASFQITGPEVYVFKDRLFEPVESTELASTNDFTKESIARKAASFNRVMSTDTKILSVNELHELYSAFRNISDFDIGLRMNFLDAINALDEAYRSNDSVGRTGKN